MSYKYAEVFKNKRVENWKSSEGDDSKNPFRGLAMKKDDVCEACI